MALRYPFWPRSVTDIGSTAFLALAVPLIFWFGLDTVLPALVQRGSCAFYAHAALGLFIVSNIVGNHLALMLTDPSIRKRHLNAPPVHANNADRRSTTTEWHLCAVCEALVPPRAWHCSECAVCVLKRDHHCAFSGCCVGHANQRFFWWLVVYVSIGAAYAACLTATFLFGVHAERFWTPMTAVRVLFPFAVILFEPGRDQLWCSAFLVCVLGALFAGFLSCYHGQNIAAGMLTHERDDAQRPFDLGWRRNVRLVLGERWWLTWLSPFVRSELPTDGIDWDEVRRDAAAMRKSH